MVSAFKEPIFNTRPFLPPLDEFTRGLKLIWEHKWLTNDGPIVREYEQALADYFHTPDLCLFANGTLALQIGLQALEVSGEVITTPFTFVATAHSLFWNRVRPVFCDIEPDTLTLDPDRVEALITPWTSAILAVHVFGNPCRLSRLQEIAHRHKLHLIYDAAHAFGVKVEGRPLVDFGDLSMVSFHATKVYHSFEGGLLVFRDGALKKKLNYLKNFGFENEVEVMMPGTNAKMTEVHALMGLLMLRYADQIIDRRRAIDSAYRERLAGVSGLRFIAPRAGVRHNYAYMPVLIDETAFGLSRDEVYHALKAFNVYPRRYFYPLVCDHPCYKALQIADPLTVARRTADQVLCLPIYPDLALDDVHRVCDIILDIRENRAEWRRRVAVFGLEPDRPVGPQPNEGWEHVLDRP
ncbi:MAG: DegT/DnrJ/EryC1/StrS family aminotransferase [Proteobacteria bacterium]|nr:DegT/DnrJ/EryC1/StrS family aminotransferase [Pseudomonadota bacterium]